ncbi:MAG: hypothetical protein ACRDSH_11560 [Pseudonocardiaceae bacterium]
MDFEKFANSEMEKARRYAEARVDADPSAKDLTIDHYKRLRPKYVPTDPTIKGLVIARNQAFNNEDWALVQYYDQELVDLDYDPDAFPQ